MSKRIYVKPLEGLLVRNPKNKNPIPADGAWIDTNSFWNRRIRDGSLIITDPPEKEAQEKEDESKNYQSKRKKKE